MSSSSAITNRAFLTAIFGAHLDHDHDPRLYAWVCEHGHDWPEGATAHPTIWAGRVWDEGEFFEGVDITPRNTYFSTALLKATAEKGAVLSTVKRRKVNFGAMPCVMLDDIGSKADESLPVPPSWMIETSPGNFQAGYIFETPITAASDADAFLRALATAGRLTDPGGQNIARYARLPVGFNLKAKYRTEAGDPFRHRLVEWAPERRYDWRDLAEALGLDLEVHETIRSRKSRSSLRGLKTEVSDDEVFEGKADEHPVITALKARNLYKSPLGSGKHDITCPWVHEHTDKIDGGTVYYEPDPSFPRGGFKCQHGHCEGRRIGALLEFLSVSNAEAKNRDRIRVIGGALHTIVSHAERLMAQTGHYFQQGGLIVQIVTDPRGETRVMPLTKPAVQLTLTRLASWQRLDKRSDAWFEIDAPSNHSAVLGDASEYRHLPVLQTLTRQPFLRPDGTVATRAGYDAPTGLYGVFDPREFPINENPTRTEAAHALTRMVGLLSEFEFATPADKAAALAGMLTGAVRSSLPTAPGFLATAHSYGSGKSYLLDLLAGFATTDEAAATTFVLDDDEMRKQLVACLMESPPVLKFDEMRGDLVPVKAMLAALTQHRIEGRILGVSKMARPGTRTLMLFAGNNVQAVQDMTRRVVTIKLDPQCETPATREFGADPLRDQLRPQRGRYVADALTVIRGWLAAGSPKSGIRPLNGFSQWSDWCREPLLWLGLPDPCEQMFMQMQDDPDRELLTRLLSVWNSCFGTHPQKVRDLIRRAEDVADLHEVLTEAAGFKGDIDSHKLGKWLKHNAGKIANGMRLAKDTTFTRNSIHWKLTLLSGGVGRRDYRDYRDSSPNRESRDSRDSRDSPGHEEKVSPNEEKFSWEVAP